MNIRIRKPLALSIVLVLFLVVRDARHWRMPSGIAIQIADLQLHFLKPRNGFPADAAKGKATDACGATIGAAAWARKSQTDDSHKLVDFPASNICSKLKPGSSRIMQGTFLYLLMDRYEPRSHWVHASEQSEENVQFIALLWNTHHSETLPTFGRFHAVCPDRETTWNSGRNILLEQARQLEKNQGWMFEYLAFVDGDVLLAPNPVVDGGVLSSPNTTLTSTSEQQHLEAMNTLHKHMLADRPLRASVQVSRPTGPRAASCIMTCGMDTMTDYYHRTTVDCLLPYSTAYDSVDWWRSAFHLNMKSTILLQPYCFVYQNVLVNYARNTHGPYPKKGDFALYRHDFIQCLNRSGFPPTANFRYLSAINLKLSMARVGPRCVPLPNRSFQDFSQIFRASMEKFPEQCK